LAGEQKDLLKKLMNKGNNTINYRIKSYAKEKMTVKFQTDCLKNSHGNSRPTYNILSIDGGGSVAYHPLYGLAK